MSTIFDNEMQDALRADAQQLRDQAAGDPYVMTPEETRAVGRPVGMILEIPLDEIAPDPAQARDEGADDSIGDTLKPDDVLPAIELRAYPSAGITKHPPYMIIDGERRWRGSMKAGRTTIRAWINPNPGDDGDRLLRQAVLNEGERLKPMEEARTWKRIMTAKGWKIQQLADAVKRAKSTVSDRLALLDAPAPFQKLFSDGTLSPAAAPIVREYRDVPERILKAAVKRAIDENWGNSIENGVTVPLDNVRSELSYQLLQSGDSELAALNKADIAYDGPVVTIAGQKYAADREALAKTRAKAYGHESPAPTRREPDRHAQQQRAAAKKARAESEARQTMIRSLGARLPTKLDDAWSLFVVKHLVSELTTDSQRHACHAIGITPPKMGKLGFEFGKAIVAHATKQGAADRVRMIVQLLLASDCYVNPHSSHPAARIAEAAKLLKIDPKKLRPAAAPKAKASATPAKKGR